MTINENTKAGEPGDYIVSVVSNVGVVRVRESIPHLNRTDAYEVQAEFVRQLKNEGWAQDAHYQSLYKMSRKSELLFISVTSAAEVWDVTKPPQHWLSRGITRVAVSA